MKRMFTVKKFRVTKETQFAVLGLGKFGRSIAHVLSENNFNVLCCDKDPQAIHEVAQYATHVIEVDLTDESALEALGLGNFDVVIVAFSEDFEAAVIATMIAKEKNVPFVLVKANGLRQKKILENAGADRVVLPERDFGERIAYHLITNDPMEYIHRSDTFDIIEMRPKPQWVGKSLSKLNLRKNEGVNVLAIIRGERAIAVLDPQMEIGDDDSLIVLKLSTD